MDKSLFFMESPNIHGKCLKSIVFSIKLAITCIYTSVIVEYIVIDAMVTGSSSSVVEHLLRGPGFDT